MLDFDGGRSRPEGRGPPEPVKSERRLNPSGEAAPSELNDCDARDIGNHAVLSALLPLPQASPQAAPSHADALACLRRQRDFEAIHALGPRPTFELLLLLAGDHPALDDQLRRFAGLDPETVRILGADRFPASPIRILGGEP